MSPQHSSAAFLSVVLTFAALFLQRRRRIIPPRHPRQHAFRAKPGFPADIHKQLRSPHRSQSAGRRPRRRSDGGSTFPQAVRQRLGRKRKPMQILAAIFARVLTAIHIGRLGGAIKYVSPAGVSKAA
jgi:hypothetical protein